MLIMRSSIRASSLIGLRRSGHLSRTGKRGGVVARLTGEGAAFALQRLAREQMKYRLLIDIRTDMQVCEIEGWDALEFVRDLHVLIAGFSPCEGVSRDG